MREKKHKTHLLLCKCVTLGGRVKKDEVYSNSLVDSLSCCHYWKSLVGWDQSQWCTTSATVKELTCHKQTKRTCLRHNEEVDLYCRSHTLLLIRDNFPKTNHKAMEHLCLNAIRKPSQAIVEFQIDGCWGILAVSVVLEGEGVKGCLRGV